MGLLESVPAVNSRMWSKSHVCRTATDHKPPGPFSLGLAVSGSVQLLSGFVTCLAEPWVTPGASQKKNTPTADPFF